MKKIRLTESDLHTIIKNSVYRILNENDVRNEITKKCAEYKEILTKEFMQAQKDVHNSTSTFHNGIAPSLRQKGYTVISNGDNWVSFYTPSRLFELYACSFGKPWALTERVTMNFSNYTWKERYQYPNYYHTLDYKQFRLPDFEQLYLKMSNEINEPVIIEPQKVTSEKIDTYNKFTVYKRGNRTYEKIKEFDNFEDAKKLAYNLAKQKCEQGRAQNDSTSKYYATTPRDITKQHSDCAVAYEYYEYNEYSYYFSVEVE